MSEFSLDDGAFSIVPPPAGALPVVTREQADCEALASIGSNGLDLLQLAQDTGLAARYGLVTVSATVGAGPHQGGRQVGGQGSPPASLPPPAPYRDRLAWTIVVENRYFSSCPAMPVSPTSMPPPRPAFTGYAYEVFLVDATSGSDALIYNEAQPAPCDNGEIIPPSRSVPIEQTSLPWTLATRNRDGYSAALTVQVPPCDAYANPILVDRGTNTVRALGYGPVGQHCGPVRPVTVNLHAATVTSNLPATLAHAPVGLYLRGTGPAEPVAPSPPTGSLRDLNAADNGGTLTVHVGDTLAPSPLLPGENPASATPVQSSDPSVLGPLSAPNGPLVEFRARKPGQATLTAPGGRWRVKVVVAPA